MHRKCRMLHHRLCRGSRQEVPAPAETVNSVLMNVDHALLDAHVIELDEAEATRRAGQAISHDVHILDLRQHGP